VRVTGAKGRPIGGFAEVGKFERVNALAELVAAKVVDVFPFEGHVWASKRIVHHQPRLRQGPRGQEGRRRRALPLDGKTPPKLTPIGRAVVRKVDAEFSRVELSKGAQKPAIGDTVVLLPRAVEASFDSALTFTVKAGRPATSGPSPT